MNIRFKIKKSPKAREDLKNIWYYIADDDERSATAFLIELEQKIFFLKDFPYIGVQRNSIKTGIRIFPYKKYSIWYIVEDEYIVIVRVLHGAKDVKNIF